MNFEMVNNVPLLQLDFLATTTIAAVLLLVGNWLRRVFPVLEKYCIPAAVIGGFGFALLALFLRETNVLNFKVDTMLQTPFQLVFFTAIGLGGSLGLLRRGGKLFVIYLIVACWLIAILQNVIGVAAAMATGIHPVLGVMAGAVSLEGGPGNAAAFGPMAEKLGVQGATVVGLASATYGIIISGFIGGPLAKWLIERSKVEIVTGEDKELEAMQASMEAEKQEDSITSGKVMGMITLILTLMTVGALAAAKIKAVTGFDLPSYVGAMFMAIVFRNIHDVAPFVRLSYKSIELIADVTLGLFLTMAMMSLKIWELYNLAIPLMVILLLQTIFIVVFCMYPLFRLLGRNYDAAVMCAGMVGHNLGVAANAVANMDAVCRRYGVLSTKSFIIVPLCGAVLVDIIGIPNIVWFINYFTK
jgi:ESS family glutamate:Na+ symporter